MAEPRVITTEPQILAAIRERIAMADIRTFFDRGFGELMEVLGAQGAAPIGPGLAVYWGIPTDHADLAIALPTADPVEPAGRVAPIELAPTRAAEIVHEGGYDSLSTTYRDLQQWIVEQDLVPGDVVWETYLTEPTPHADPADMRTRVTWTLGD